MNTAGLLLRILMAVAPTAGSGALAGMMEMPASGADQTVAFFTPEDPGNETNAYCAPEPWHYRYTGKR